MFGGAEMISNSIYRRSVNFYTLTFYFEGYLRDHDTIVDDMAITFKSYLACNTPLLVAAEETMKEYDLCVELEALDANGEGVTVFRLIGEI